MNLATETEASHSGHGERGIATKLLLTVKSQEVCCG